jgi:hypothetical protein
MAAYLRCKLTILAVVLIFAAVPAFGDKAAKICEKHPDWGSETCNRLAHHEVWVGMTVDMLHAAMGLPQHVTSFHDADGVHFSLRYDKAHGQLFETVWDQGKYKIFEVTNSKVTSWIDIK